MHRFLLETFLIQRFFSESEIRIHGARDFSGRQILDLSQIQFLLDFYSP